MGFFSRWLGLEDREPAHEKVSTFFDEKDPKQSTLEPNLDELVLALDQLLAEHTSVEDYHLDALNRWFKLDLFIGLSTPLRIEGQMSKGIQAVGPLNACCGEVMGLATAGGSLNVRLRGPKQARCLKCHTQYPEGRTYSIVTDWENSYDEFVEKCGEQMPALLESHDCDPLSSVLVAEDVHPYLVLMQNVCKGSTIDSLMRELDRQQEMHQVLAEDLKRLEEDADR